MTCRPRGNCWPDCPDTPVRKGSVLLCSSEDDAGIIRRRLDVNGADPANVLVCSGVHAGEKHGGFDLSQHAEALEQFLDDMSDLRLIVLDPVTAYLGQTNANSNAEVRNVLSPLAELAARRQVTIIGVNHHNKRQDLSFMYRGLGSTGFVGSNILDAAPFDSVYRSTDIADIRGRAPSSRTRAPSRRALGRRTRPREESLLESLLPTRSSPPGPGRRLPWTHALLRDPRRTPRTPAAGAEVGRGDDRGVADAIETGIGD